MVDVAAGPEAKLKPMVITGDLGVKAKLSAPDEKFNRETADFAHALTARVFTIPEPGQPGYSPDLALLMERVNRQIGIEGFLYLKAMRKRTRTKDLMLVLDMRWLKPKEKAKGAKKEMPRKVLRLVYAKPGRKKGDKK